MFPSLDVCEGIVTVNPVELNAITLSPEPLAAPPGLVIRYKPGAYLVQFAVTPGADLR